MITIFDEDGLINEEGGKFKGMKRFDARYSIMEELSTIFIFKCCERGCFFRETWPIQGGEAKSNEHSFLLALERRD